MKSPRCFARALAIVGGVCHLVLGVVVAVGCGGSSSWRAQVRHQASEDHECPERSIDIVRYRDDAKARRVTLDVCGRRRVYREYRPPRHEGEPRWRMVKRRRKRSPNPARARRPHKADRSHDSRPRPVVRRSKRRRDPYTSAVHRVMGKARPAFAACFHAAQRRHPSLHGCVVIRIIIDRRGHVEEAMPEVNQLTPGVGSCLVNRIRDLRFPSPRSGRATFHWPFTFEEQ